MKRKYLHQSQHPFDAHPFEALRDGSWHSVEFIEIRDGIMTINFTDSQELIVKNGPYPNIRVKSRKATSSDCTCILRPGVDVCVLSSPQLTEGSQEENAEPDWVDARVSSIERKPHDSQCSCKFFVNLYIEQGPLGSEKARLSKDTEELGIDRISILQKLDNNPCEGRSYRWRYSEDCSSVQRSKLFWVKFSSDLTWLLVTSVLKQFTFDIRSVQNKIVYQILGIDDDDSSVKSYQQPRSISFKVDNGILIPIVVQCDADDSSEAASPCSMYGAEISPVHDVSNLRRSKRRNVQPERFLACDIPPEMDVGWVRTMPYKTEKWKDEDMDLPLSYFLLARASGFQDETEGETEIHFPKPDPFEDLPDSITKTKPREVDSSIAKANREARKSQLAIVPVCSGSNPIAYERLNSPVKAPVNYSRKINGICSYYRRKGYSAARKKDNFELEDMVLESGWGGKASFSRVQAMRHRSIRPNKDDSCETVIRRKRTLSAGAYNKLINSYMKNIDSTIKSRGEEPHIMDQWEAFKSKGRTGNRVKMMEPLATEDEEEDSETEMLWREMEICMASAYLLEENEARVSTHKMSESSEYCQHEFKLDEEIGILCRICGFVRSEIKYVSAPFVENTGWNAEHKPWNDKNSEPMPDEYEDLNLFSSHASSASMPLSEENNNVWALIPELRNKLHMHQKKAFEFLWRNIAGSMVPARMEKASKKIGGCVVSHTPGAGKTFLIIAFLVSYLKLFPGRRPLVLAPKTTLYTWYKEFIKWQIPVPVHLIHGRRTYSAFRQKSSVVTFRGDLKPSLDVMHVLDCLEKIQKWHAQPSVLVMGYTSFLTLMREDAKFAHRKYMAKVLRESPGILVLDEGHNPRSTKSRLRKVLMKVETDLRVLLSGTLFQNNFCEYFNTLCLARPKFIREVLRRLDPKFKRKKQGKEKARHLLESRARKLFLDNIAKKVDSSNLEEQKQGLKMLRKMTNRFIDVYESGSSDGLPGLQIYTILMNSTDIQHDVLTKIHKIMATYPGFPLELELLITLASIHPWLITTSNCVNKFFSSRELRELEKLQFECRKGSKVMFVLNLVYRVVRKEKVLIFCHNIAPINLFLGLFEKVFRWQKGREILVLTGDLELFERGRVMDKFEEPGSPSRVLLASITACAEGISLTAASRVIMMDSEWNPSKTRQAIARAFRPGQQKVVYVYQLLATRTLEEDKYRRTTWKEWVSSMIFSEAFVEDPSRWQAEKIEDDVLREIVGEDRVKSFHMIMKNEKASRVNNGLTNSGLTELHSDNK